MIIFAVSLLFLAAQAWTWGRLIVFAYFGDDRAKMGAVAETRVSRVVAAAARRGAGFRSGAVAAHLHPARHTHTALATVALGALFIVAVWVRKPRSGRRAGSRWCAASPFRVYCSAVSGCSASLAAAPIAMIVA